MKATKVVIDGMSGPAGRSEQGVMYDEEADRKRLCLVAVQYPWGIEFELEDDEL